MKAQIDTPYHSYNRYFFGFFLLWLIVGGILQLCYSQEEIFKAINTRHTPFLDKALYVFTLLGEGVSSAIILVSFFAWKAYRNWWYFLTAALSNVVPAVLVTQSLKSIVAAPRPMRLLGEMPWIHYLPEWPLLMERSFPSGHTCAAFSLWYFLACLLKPGYKFWGVVFFFCAAITGYSRVYLTAHFFRDVYVASIIAIVFVTLILALMRRFTPSRTGRTPETKIN